MKLFIAIAVCAAFFAAVAGREFQYECIRMDVNGTVTVTANNNGTKSSAAIDLSTANFTADGNCSQSDAVQMTVNFDAATWVLMFNATDGKVTLDQTVSFNATALFNSSADTVTVSSNGSLPLSSNTESFQCDSGLNVTFAAQEQSNSTFEVVQDIQSLMVQAFDLPKNKSYSPAKHCDGDVTTVAPTTEATTTAPLTPTPPPATEAQTFEVKDNKSVVCFRLVAGLQFVVEYETKDNKTVLSKNQIIRDPANVTGTCATGNTATMVITGGDYSLSIVETRDKGVASSAITLSVTMDAKNFPNAKDENQTMSFELTTFQQGNADTFYRCDTEQMLAFPNTTTALFTNDVQLQAFNLNNGNFSGKGERCGLDPTPSPMPPAAKPGNNVYSVSNDYHNLTCIVFEGEITFANVTYITTNKESKVAMPIVIPALNESLQNVNSTGNCDLENGMVQQLVITFNSNWTLTLNFSKGGAKSMLGASEKQYSVRDIEFVYYLTPEFFPNASTPDVKVSVSRTNLTTDFMKGAINGGSYKCNASQTETLGEGVEFQTADLQYKAFNNDNKTTFSNNVMQCSADDESNSIVPIAVGAALAGLVAIVLIAYLIGRRRSRRQGYESV